MNSHIAFRVDASEQTGAGHFMRCLTLADALQERGARIRFLSRHLSKHLLSLLRARGHEFTPLGSGSAERATDDLPHSSWLGTSQAADVGDTIRALSDRTWDLIVVDHYALDSRWESALRSVTNNVMVIDDVADRAHDCDLLLDQNIYPDMETRYSGRVPGEARLLLGPHYALLRARFRQMRAQVHVRRGPVKRILVLFGGFDPHDLTGRALAALDSVGDPSLAVDVVIGAEHPRREWIQEICATSGYQCHLQTERIPELMADADLALGAGGSTSWERCCLGLPAICVSLANNQYPIANALQKTGACLFLGDDTAATQAVIETAVLFLMGSGNTLTEMSMKAIALVDGHGTRRVCDTISEIIDRR